MLLVKFYGESGWNVEHLKAWLPMEVVVEIQGTQLYPDQEDCIVWLDSPSKEFTVKSAWEVLQHRQNRSTVDMVVWNRLVPLKVSFFAWKAVWEFVLVELTLKKFGFNLIS